jgi:hypothetical protein
MYREKRPTVAAGFIMGAVGSVMSSGSAGMARICYEGIYSLPPIPLVIYREDGVEIPTFVDERKALAFARVTLRGLWLAAPWARTNILPAGEAVRASIEPPPYQRLSPQPVAHAWQEVARLRRAEPRLAPWVAVVEVVLSRVAG